MGKTASFGTWLKLLMTKIAYWGIRRNFICLSRRFHLPKWRHLKDIFQFERALWFFFFFFCAKGSSVCFMVYLRLHILKEFGENLTNTGHVCENAEVGKVCPVIVHKWIYQEISYRTTQRGCQHLG